MRVLFMVTGSILMLFGVASGGCAIRVFVDGLDAPVEHVHAVDFLVPVVCLVIGAGLIWTGGVWFHRGFRPGSRDIAGRSPTVVRSDAADAFPTGKP